jgi:hypothetical protein
MKGTFKIEARKTPVNASPKWCGLLFVVVLVPGNMVVPCSRFFILNAFQSFYRLIVAMMNTKTAVPGFVHIGSS